ncbi:MAG: hypothetical protein ACYCXA_13905 [Actinomycetes bacterium]
MARTKQFLAVQPFTLAPVPAMGKHAYQSATANTVNALTGRWSLISATMIRTVDPSAVRQQLLQVITTLLADLEAHR